MAKSKAPRTAAQVNRQGYRKQDGRYSEFRACNRCGKSAGEEYFSDERAANKEGNLTLVLCWACAYYLSSLHDEDFESDLANPRYGRLPQGKI